MIEVNGLSKYYGGNPAIEGVSFSIADGEIVGLLGLNGAGKSTILKILGCFLMPSSGRASIGGFSIEDNPDSIRGIIGYLPDTPPLYNEMTVRAYLEYVAKLKGVGRGAVKSSVDSAIEKTSLGEVADASNGSLSHGFRQRVGIAQAIVHNPRVLILDEPINGLDPIQIVEMRDLVVSLRNDHTVILSSHILSEITRTCDRILIVDKGRLVAEGDESQLKGAADSMRIACEVESPNEALLGTIRAISGVKEASMRGGEILIEMSTDCRKEIAAAIVGSNAGLLSLSQKGDALESLFMKFVRSDA